MVEAEAEEERKRRLMEDNKAHVLVNLGLDPSLAKVDHIDTATLVRSMSFKRRADEDGAAAAAGGGGGVVAAAPAPAPAPAVARARVPWPGDVPPG